MVMRPTTLVITAAGTSQAVPLDNYVYGMAVAATNVTGSSKFTLQHTFTDPGIVNLNSAGAGIWFNHDDTTFVNASANVNSNYAFVPRASRVIVASGSTGFELDVTFVPTVGV